jgi:hypothetical protein
LQLPPIASIIIIIIIIIIMVRFIILFMLLAPAHVTMAQLRTSPNTKNSGLTGAQQQEDTTRVLAKKNAPAKKAGGKPSKPVKPASTTTTTTTGSTTAGTVVRTENATSGGVVVNTNLNGGVRTCLNDKYGKSYWQGTNTGCMTNADCSGIVVKDGTACCLWPYCICGASTPGATGVGCSTV